MIEQVVFERVYAKDILTTLSRIDPEGDLSVAWDRASPSFPINGALELIVATYRNYLVVKRLAMLGERPGTSDNFEGQLQFKFFPRNSLTEVQQLVRSHRETRWGFGTHKQGHDQKYWKTIWRHYPK